MNKFLLLCLLVLVVLVSVVSAWDYESVDFRESYVHINTTADVSVVRSELVDWIWKSGQYNKTPVVTTITTASIATWSGLSTNNVSQISQYYYNNGTYTYKNYLMKNSNPNNRLFIYNSGHAGGGTSGQSNFVNAALNEGYDVGLWVV